MTPELADRTFTLSQAFASVESHNGTYVVDGYGLRVHVERGHLVSVDGIGRHRRERRFSRAERDLRRLVVLGHSGTVSLEALRWMADVGVSFLHIDSDGRVLTSSASPGLNDARLRRAQAAATPEIALVITRALLHAKLSGQARVVRDLLQERATADAIASMQSEMSGARDLDQAREVEASAALAYFGSWRDRVRMTFAAKDVGRLPGHWQDFSVRKSPISTGFSAIRAADPINALLNYLYALAEAECRLACLVLGLDPGLGFLHADAKSRDSLALDLLETVRPSADAWLHDLLEGHVFRKADFVERPNGHGRILPPLTHHLAGTCSLWLDAVAPHAEHVVEILTSSNARRIASPTPLTSRRRRASSWEAATPRRRPGKQQRSKTGTGVVLAKTCQGCGAPLGHRQRRWCSDCWAGRRAEAGLKGSERARAALVDQSVRQMKGRAISAGKEASIADAAVRAGWQLDDWESRIRPGLADVPLAQIMAATGLSITTASGIRTGKRRPHPRHWEALVALAR